MDEEQLFGSGKEDNRRLPAFGASAESGMSKNNGEQRNICYNTNYNTNYEKTNKKGCLFWGLAVLAAFITINTIFFFGIVAIVASMTSSNYEYEDTIYGDYVEMIRIEGTIARNNVNSYGIPVGYQHEWLLNKIDYLKADESNKGILLYINSGGGTTYESDEMYLALKSYKEETGRPIYAYYANTAASGALYISMAADEIYANRMSNIGSIGVRLTYYNMKELMDKLGIKEVSISSGKNKTMLSSYEELTDEQRLILQTSVDESYQYFVEIVAENRGIPLEKVYEIADGRTYTPKQSLELGLIDGIEEYSDFLDDMFQRSEFADCEFYEDSYTDTSFWGILFSKIPDKTKAYSEADVLMELLERNNSEPVFE
ncbi:MAG: signal peptide peptidase SppA [Firmicutes bacterium]|nr:signal peptide peptidase SppA [Bacillota bacterium]